VKTRSFRGVLENEGGGGHAIEQHGDADGNDCSRALSATDCARHEPSMPTVSRAPAPQIRPAARSLPAEELLLGELLRDH